MERKLIKTQSELVEKGVENLSIKDPEMFDLLNNEVMRQHRTLSLVASCCAVLPETLYASSSALVNVTAEGTPGRRYHAGCSNVDKVESLAIKRACELFGAQYANVQPHSASNANYEVLCALLKPGDTLLGMSLSQGGHLSHGSAVSVSGQFFNSIGYGTTAEGSIDYEQVQSLAHEYSPKVIICGTTAYSRKIDFKKFREIADSVGAILIADISHITGLVVTGRHESPINEAHITTTCVHKQLEGPRGGLILSGKDADTLVPGTNTTFRKLLNKAVFPGMQGAPIVNLIAAKAVAFKHAMSPEYDEYIGRIREIANNLVTAFKENGYEVIGGESDTHQVLLRLPNSMTGIVAQEVLEECSIIVNKNTIPGETRSPFVASGLRLGTGGLAQRFIDKKTCYAIANLVCDILKHTEIVGERKYTLDNKLKERYIAAIENICKMFPIQEYTR